MALSPASPSPSSSAVTLPRPGKSILKKPPPPQHSFFSLSRFSRLLPNQPSGSSPSNASTSSSSTRDPNGNGADAGRDRDADVQQLKRAHFFLPALATVYPISASNPPSMPTTKEEKRTVEAREAERRKRVVRGNSFGPSESGQSEDWWSLDKVESFYRECCQGREEQPHSGIAAALKRASGANGRSLDLSGVQITLAQAATLSDVFSVEWGLRKLFLKECDLDEHNLKPILHALLIPNSLNFLSVASNRRLKTPAFKILGSFVSKSKNLQFLDLSMNVLDKKSVECIACALKPSATASAGSAASVDMGTGLVSLRMDDCSLRPAALEILAQSVRTSSLRNISLRHNRISASSAVALALMIKDYPDTMPSTYTTSQSSSLSSASSSPNSSSTNLFNTLSPPITPITDTPPLTPNTISNTVYVSQVQAAAKAGSPRLPSFSLAVPSSSLPSHSQQSRLTSALPPPIHPSNAPLQTTYTPYIPKARRLAAMSSAGATATARAVQNASRAPDNPYVPVITSSSGGGVVVRHAVNGTMAGSPAQAVKKASTGPSAALLDKVRALDSLPRLGELRTLDLRGNDIRTGITYVAQVLKRNRTLKVLNICENKIDVQGLVAIAEALKYNLTLETLDLSKNVCSGPALDGIQSLRTAFTLNTSLKRLFLTGTGLTSAGAIALAEFLPESSSLLHLDLTNNNLELAGVMALSEGLKANHVMRCLDLNIPPDDDEFARDILNTCVRNTEYAEKTAKAIRGTASAGKAVWGMIEESELAKTFKKGESKKVDEDLLTQAKMCLSQLEELHARLLAFPPAAGRAGSVSTESARAGEVKEGDNDEDVDELIERARSALLVIEDVIQVTDDPIRIEELFFINDSITGALSRIEDSRRAPDHSSSSSGTPPPSDDSPASGATTPRSHLQQKADAKLNGLRLVIPSAQPLTTEPEALDTPRIDKGKGRAAPEPVFHELVTSPNIVLRDSDEEDEGEEVVEEEEAGGVPTNGLSKVMVEEEGEVFRKGHVLLTSKEMEGEYDGEELRIELLEARVERPPPRSLNSLDEFSLEQLPPLPSSPSTPLVSQSSSSNSLDSYQSPTMTDGFLSPLSPSASASISPGKAPPKPYIRRTQSASSASASPIVASPSLTEMSIKGGQLSPSIAQVQSQANNSHGSGNGNGIGLGIMASREGLEGGDGKDMGNGNGAVPYAPRKKTSTGSFADS